MITQSKQIRPFVGAKDFKESRAFYQALGFEEVIIDKKVSLFKINDHLGFYLQDAYVRDWIDNTMIFVEVEASPLEYPDYYNVKKNKNAKELNDILLSKIPESRLKGSFINLKTHKFFDKFDWVN